MINLVYLEEEGRITYDATVLVVPEFMTLYNKDTTPDKSIVDAQLKHILFTCEINHDKNPLSVTPLERKKEEAFRLSGCQVEWTETEEYLQAVSIYLEYNLTTEKRAISILDEKIVQCANMLENIVPSYEEQTLVNGDLKFVDNSKNIENVTNLLTKLITNKEDLIKKITDNTVTSKKTQGNKQQTWLELQQVRTK